MKMSFNLERWRQVVKRGNLMDVASVLGSFPLFSSFPLRSCQSHAIFCWLEEGATPGRCPGRSFVIPPKRSRACGGTKYMIPLLDLNSSAICISLYSSLT